MVTGRSLDAHAARDVGLVDAVADDAVSVASALALRLAGGEAPRLGWPNFEDGTAEVASVREAIAKIRKAPSPEARDALVRLVEIGVTEGYEAGLAAEREAFFSLLVSEQSLALRHLFAAETVTKRGGDGGTRPIAIGVVGAGQMGAGIAATAVLSGVTANLHDVDAARIEEARARAEKAVAGAPGWSGSTGWEGFAEADLVVEAVFELPELKREVLAEVASVARPDAVITTNTSAIQISRLADAVSDPSRFLGTHFFSPVELMPLVELVPHEGTSTGAIATARNLARALGKNSVVVDDRPGFFTSRVYARWLIEGLRLLLDGVPSAQIEAEAKQIGFPVGPLQAHDEATLELVRQASITQVAESVMADRIDVAGVKALLGRLIEAGVEGRRQGAGFYLYTDGRRGEVNPAVPDIVGSPAASLPVGEAGERLLLAFVTECLLCWDEAVLCHPDDGDVASVLGIGFPRLLGGPFHWVDRQGAASVVARCTSLGEAFPTGESLVRLAASGATYAAETRLPRPGRS